MHLMSEGLDCLHSLLLCFAKGSRELNGTLVPGTGWIREDDEWQRGWRDREGMKHTHCADAVVAVCVSTIVPYSCFGVCIWWEGCTLVHHLRSHVICKQIWLALWTRCDTVAEISCDKKLASLFNHSEFRRPFTLGLGDSAILNNYSRHEITLFLFWGLSLGKQWHSCPHKIKQVGTSQLIYTPYIYKNHR